MICSDLEYSFIVAQRQMDINLRIFQENVSVAWIALEVCQFFFCETAYLIFIYFTMRRCKNCGKYFALTVHGSTEYCSRVFDSRGRTCKEVGAMRQYAQLHASDELLKIYRREYKRCFAWIRAGKISQEVFSAWSRQMQQEKEKCDKGEITRDEFVRRLKR